MNRSTGSRQVVGWFGLLIGLGLLVRLAPARAAIMAYEDFEATTLSDGADISAISLLPHRGLETWTDGKSAFTARASGALSGALSGELTDTDPGSLNTSDTVQILPLIGSQLTGQTTWMSMKLRTDQAPVESLRFGLKIGTGVNPITDAALGWFPTSNSKWLDRLGNPTTSIDPVATPQPNTTYDILFGIGTTTYDVWINGVQIFNDAVLSTPNTGANRPYNFGILTGELAANGATKVLVDDWALYNADPRMGVEEPGTSFRMVNKLQSSTRIDDSVLAGDEVVWTSMNGAFSAYRPDGGVARGVVDINGEDPTSANNPIDIAATADRLGYFASPLNPGGANDLEAGRNTIPAGAPLFNAGLTGYPKILTAGQRVESGSLTNAMFVLDPAGNRVRRYTMDATAFFGFSFSDVSIALAVDLAYADGLDTLYWATSDGRMMAGDLTANTTMQLLTDSRIDADTKINAGLFGGQSAILVSYNDGTWGIINGAGTELKTGGFTGVSGQPLDVAFGDQRIYWLADDGLGGSSLYTLYLLPEPSVALFLALGGGLLARAHRRRGKGLRHSA